MCRRNAFLLAVACLSVAPHFLQASVIIKTIPHANVKMEFGAHHVPPHDVALLEESAKVDGTTRLGIEVPHSQNHRNVLIHKIGTYLTVVMKALAKTVAPSQNQDGKTHFDIHVDADLGENDSKDKKDESPQFTIVQTKHGEVAEQIKGDCVKAVVIVSESEGDGKKEEHESSGKHSKDEHKKKDSHMVLHYSSEDSKESKEGIHEVLEEKIQISKGEKEEHKSSEKHSKDEHKKESNIVFHYSSEDSKESKDHHKQSIHEVLEEKIQVSKGEKEEHKSSEKHSKDEHKKKESNIVFHYSSEDSKESKDHHKQSIVSEEKMQFSKGKKEEHKSSEKHHKDEHKKKNSNMVLHYSSEDSKESKDHHKQSIHEVLEEKIQLSKGKKKEDVIEPFIIQVPKDWESFKKTQEMLKEKGLVLQLDNSFFISKENQHKSSQKAETLDVKNKINLSLERKSLSEEETKESERNWKSLELTEADPEEMWSMINPTDIHSRHQSLSEKNELHLKSPSYSKTQTGHTPSVNDVSKGGKQIQTVKTTYQSGPVIITTTKSVGEVPPNGNKAVSYEMVKQSSTPEKLSPANAELSFTDNEIPSHVSSHFQQTSYSSDRSRSMTIVSSDPTIDPSKGVMTQPVVFQVKDKLKEMSEAAKTIPHLKPHDDSSREVIMRLAPTSKTGPTKKAQIIDAKKVKITKPDIPDKVEPDGTASRQEGVRKLPMANIPTLIDVLQKSPPQEVQRLTQVTDGGSSQESQTQYSSAEVANSPIASTNITDPLPSKSPREFQLPELHVSDLNSEEPKGLTKSIEDLKSFAPNDYKDTFETARNEKLHTHPEIIHTPKEGGIVEVPSSEHPDGTSKGLEVTKKGNLEDNPSAEELERVKYISENPSNLKSVELIINTEPDKQQKELVIDSLNNDNGQIVQQNAKDGIVYEGERNQKTLHTDAKNLEKEEKASGTSATIAIEEIGDDPRASHAFSLCSLTASAEEARALDISSPQVENQPAEIPVANDSPVEEVAVSPMNLNQVGESSLKSVDVSDTAEQMSEGARLGRNMTSPSQSEETEHKKEIIVDEPPFIEDKAVVHGEPQEATPSDIHSVLSTYDDSLYVISPTMEPSTTPSLPEKESMSAPMYKETQVFLEDDPNKVISNLVDLNAKVPVGEADRDGRIYDSRLGSSSVLTPLSGIVPETLVSTPEIPLNNAIHDPNSPYIYSYYPAFYPKGVYTPQNKTEDAQGLYGRPSPRVICVNTDTGKYLGDSSDIDNQSNTVAKYSPEVSKTSKEDDKLMLLKLLHEDIQKLKQQLKVQ